MVVLRWVPKLVNDRHHAVNEWWPEVLGRERIPEVAWVSDVLLIHILHLENVEGRAVKFEDAFETVLIKNDFELFETSCKRVHHLQVILYHLSDRQDLALLCQRPQAKDHHFFNVLTNIAFPFIVKFRIYLFFDT